MMCGLRERETGSNNRYGQRKCEQKKLDASGCELTKKVSHVWEVAEASACYTRCDVNTPARLRNPRRRRTGSDGNRRRRGRRGRRGGSRLGLGPLGVAIHEPDSAGGVVAFQGLALDHLG